MRCVVAIRLVAPSGMTILAAPMIWDEAVLSVPCVTLMFQAPPETLEMVSPEVKSLTKFRPKVSDSTASCGSKSLPA